MPILNFSKQFASAVEDGTKRQTIRAERKRPVKVGDVLHLYTGLRQKGARRLRAPETCIEAADISIYWKYLKSSKSRSLQIYLQGTGNLGHFAIQQLAREDGFESVTSFTSWFLPVGVEEFNGQLIKW